MTLKSVAIGTLAIGGVALAPVVPRPMTLEVSYQYPVAQTAIVEQLNIKNNINLDQPVYQDIDGDGMISVSKFIDMGGNAHYVQLHTAAYSAMGLRNGVLNNPTDIEMVSPLSMMTPHADAAIGWNDAAFTGSGSGTSVTKSYTVTSGSNLLMALGLIADGGSTDVLTNVAYNGSNLTAIAGASQCNATNGYCMYMQYLIAPSTGANNIVFSFSSSRTADPTVSTYTGAKQSGQPDASNKNTPSAGASSGTVSVTTVADQAWVIGYSGDGNGHVAAGAGVTERAVFSGVSPNYFGAIGDSNAAQAASTPYSMTWNTVSGTDTFVMGIFSIAPAAGSVIAPARSDDSDILSSFFP